MEQFTVGQSVRREEDPRLLRGLGNYIHDMALPGLAHGYVLRSPHAHARIIAIDTRRARGMPGMIAVFTGKDIASDKLGMRRCHVPRKRPDGSPMFQASHPGLVAERARIVGDSVAYVVAETLLLAKDAAEAIDVEYEPLPSVVQVSDAVAPGAPAVWDECPDNVSFMAEFGDARAVGAAFERAHRVVRERLVITRIASNAIEPRGCIADYDVRSGRFTLYTCAATPHRTRGEFAGAVFGIPESRMRVVCGDIGGSFGAKGEYSNENLIALWASRRVGRPIKWIAERSEAFLADDHGRDNVTEVELALDRDGRFLALRARTLCNLGAYLTTDVCLLPTTVNVGTMAGVYTIPAIHVAVRGVITNTTPTGPTRGAGRPEACYVIEAIIDRAAREMDLDRAELRRRNLIPPQAMPYRTALTFTFDCGDFEKCMNIALDLADYRGFEARRAEARARGALRGFGIAYSIERAAGPIGAEVAEIRFDPRGGVTLHVGSMSQGQGHETIYKMLLSDQLGIEPGSVAFVQGDTDRVAWGAGTYGARTAAVGGSAVVRATEKIIEKGRRIAAHLLEAAPADVAFGHGIFTVSGTDRSLALNEVARAAFEHNRMPPGIEPGLVEAGVFEPQTQTFPNGCHICELEIDEDTGRVRILRFVAVGDVGNVLNPLILDGQIHGGAAMGSGQALMEHMAYDRATGQLVSGSYMDYAMPRASDLCDIQFTSHPVPTRQNPLGVKGAGEIGTVGALPAVMSAALDALAPIGVRHIDMPLTPEKVWREIRKAKRSGSS